MDEKKLLEQIKNSANEIETPECLKPEQVEDMLGKVKQKKRKLPVYRLGGAAAVFLLVLVALWQVNVIGLDPGKGGMTEGAPEAATEATGKSTEEAAEEAATEAEEMTEAAADTEVIPHVTSKEELYQALSQMMGNARSTGAMAKEATTDLGVELEAAAEDAAGDSLNGTGDYSQTNLQEAGVDEGDIIKTDGDYLYALSGSRVRIIKADGGTFKNTSEIQISGNHVQVQEMYLAGNILSIITVESESALEEESEDVYYISRDESTCLYTYDISNRQEPLLTGKVSQEGYYQTSRKTGDIIYLFTRYMPVMTTTRETSHYMPRVNGEEMLIDDIFLPESRTESDYLVISSVNVKEPNQILDTKSIVSGAYLFYVSTENIYICNNWYENGSDTTQILKFSYRDGEIQAAAAGEVAGYVNDSFSLNESGGYLRVVATDWQNAEPVNHLYVLDEALSVYGAIENIAPGETIQSARFFGDTGYFVTFRQVDPLFSVDLSDPANPQILGELKVTGFSSYLHFYGENKLLGIGNEVNPETGSYEGIKISMFDITDPANVTEIDKYVLRDTYDCPGIYNYKAILVNPEKNILGFECDSSYLVFSYQEGEGFIQKFFYDPEINTGDYFYNMRGSYIGDTFYLSQDGGIQAFDMTKEYEKIGELEYDEKVSENP